MATIPADLGSTSTQLQFEDEVSVIGISGGSCSGKSSLANYLCEKFPHSITIHQDDFYRDIAHIPQSQEGNYLWDGGDGHTHTHTRTHTHTHTRVHTVPESLDAGKLVQSIKKTMQGPLDFCKVCTTRQQPHDEQAPQPLMSSPSPSPSPSTATTTGTATATATSISTDPLTTLRHLIIVEGTMILNISELRSLFRAAFFITVDYDTSSQRRRCRDYGSIEDPPGYFDDHVWPGYLRDKKLAESLTNPTVYTLDGGKPLEQLQGEIENKVTALDPPLH